MALSDQLFTLATRTKEAESRAAAARTETREQLERDIESRRKSAQENASQFAAKVQSMRGDVSEHWLEAQQKWSHEVEKVRHDMEEKHAEHDLHKAQKQADRAERDAAFAIDFALSAVAEAERETLEAELRRKYADELAPAR